MRESGENDENGKKLNFNFEKCDSAYPNKLRDVQLFIVLWV